MRKFGLRQIARISSNCNNYNKYNFELIINAAHFIIFSHTWISYRVYIYFFLVKLYIYMEIHFL